MIWRVVSSDRLNISLRDLKTIVTFNELMAAHATLDALEDAEHEAREKARLRSGAT